MSDVADLDRDRVRGWLRDLRFTSPNVASPPSLRVLLRDALAPATVPTCSVDDVEVLRRFKDWDEFKAVFDGAGPPTADDVTLDVDGTPITGRDEAFAMIERELARRATAHDGPVPT
jgi:hypothetical protein